MDKNKIWNIYVLYCVIQTRYKSIIYLKINNNDFDFKNLIFLPVLNILFIMRRALYSLDRDDLED